MTFYTALSFRRAVKDRTEIRESTDILPDSSFVSKPVPI